MLEKIRAILLSHEGKENPVTSAEIARQIGIDEDDTHLKTRSLILECAKNYELPVAAGNRGYYIITTLQEYDEYIDNLDARIKGIEERKRIITQNFKGREE